MTRMWGGRFAGDQDPAFESFNRSLAFDRRLLAADLACSAAWAAELGRAGVLADEDVAALRSALGRVGEEAAASPELLDRSSAEDVHSYVEERLADRVGDLARTLGTGRSRNDQVATDLKLHLKERGARITEALDELMGALVELAAENAALALPGYTHLQRAQPITAGHHALAYVEMLARDRGRFADALARMDTCPLGTAALAGTAFEIDREELARELGFAGGPARNSLDAVGDRDHACEVVFAASLAMVHLSRLAEDWIFFASREAGFLEFSDAVATGSSLMPQKKNPDAMELVRGKCGRVVGHLSGLLMTLKGLPLAYDKDLQEDKEALFDALDTLEACLRVTALTARNLTFDGDACEEAASRGYLNATDLADLLVREGVAFREAHERVGVAVRQAVELGVELEELPREIWNELLPELAARDPRAELSLGQVLARRSVLGGTAPERVRAEVELWKRRLSAWT